MTQVDAIVPEPAIERLLPGAQFIDAYRVSVADAALDASEAARIMLEQTPGWVDALMAVRNAVVRPLGLKTGHAMGGGDERIGLFPVQSATPARVVLGFPDKHLDFCVVVDVSGAGADGRTQVTATTLVRLNNALGRVYLAAILPFHQIIVRAALARVAARWRAAARSRKPGRHKGSAATSGPGAGGAPPTGTDRRAPNSAED